MSIVVLVPGYGGPLRAVERWRMAVAQQTLGAHGGGRLVVSGHRGEAERLAALTDCPDLIVEPTAQTTWQNVERSIPYFEDADEIAIASDWFHARRAGEYLRRLRPDLARRLVPARRRWSRGLWIQAGGALYAAAVAARRRDMPVKQCCEEMREHVEYRCDDHPDPYDCADSVVVQTDEGYFGLPIHDGGSSHIVIRHCPWCGARLPDPPD